MPKDQYPQKCSICGAAMNNIHQTHNALPINEGRCCSVCNDTIVIPARFARIFRSFKAGNEAKRSDT